MKYGYIILKYIHDILREEALNVGVLMYSPDEKFIAFKAREDLSELKKMFPDFEAAKLKPYLRQLEKIFKEKNRVISALLPFKKAEDVISLAHEIIRPDESSIQWGRIGSGISKNLEVTLNDINKRYVQQIHYKSRHGKSDSKVWTIFSEELKRRNMLSMFKPTQIKIKGSVQNFEHTFQNGALHCLRPLSLDMANYENMIEKAIVETGRYLVIKKQKNTPKIKMYYLLGEPEDKSLKSKLKDVRDLLSIDPDVQIFTEKQTVEMAEHFMKCKKSHEKRAN